ncbi:hypothetical protein NE237_006697 [Protea cynaroides]|uniref:Uncharacterized protein n=1 Tax=Protea cynaroides TaxID=273540 RepID=A0A9Q0KMV7_9MAGN|nr:hypothetical protein NE237_006697 [Protea cynaroides]
MLNEIYVSLLATFWPETSSGISTATRRFETSSELPSVVALSLGVSLPVPWVESSLLICPSAGSSSLRVLVGSTTYTSSSMPFLKWHLSLVCPGLEQTEHFLGSS